MSRLVGASERGSSISAVELLFERWPDLVGADLADVSRPVKVEGRRLVIEVSDAASGTELRWRERRVLDRLAQIAGESPVTGFKVLVRSHQRPL